MTRPICLMKSFSIFGGSHIQSEKLRHSKPLTRTTSECSSDNGVQRLGPVIWRLGPVIWRLGPVIWRLGSVIWRLDPVIWGLGPVIWRLGMSQPGRVRYRIPSGITERASTVVDVMHPSYRITGNTVNLVIIMRLYS